jgi:hypothetical protein
MLTALEQAIDSLTKEDFKNCFEDWFIRMQKCIDACHVLWLMRKEETRSKVEFPLFESEETQDDKKKKNTER